MTTTLATRPFVPSPQQQAFFDWVRDGRGNCILEAVAGAGKTTTIVKALELMRGYVFLGAFNKKMADELKARVAGRKGVFASTFHGAGFNALRFCFKDKKLEVDGDKVIKMAKLFCATENRADLLPLAGATASCVSMAKQRGFGAIAPMDNDDAWREMIGTYSLDEDFPEGENPDKIIAFAKVMLKRSNDNLDVIDFDDMVYLPLQRNIRMLTNDWVLIDEAQDTNPTRRALARKMLKPGGRLVAVGDPHQAIFGFTGADNDSLDQIDKQFGCIRLPLSITYRCPKAVVRHAQQWVNHIQSGDTAPEGSVTSATFAGLIKALKVCDKPSHTAVVCRKNKHLVSLFFRLVREGVPAKIEGREIGEGLLKLAGKWKVKQLDVVIRRLELWRENEIKHAMEKGREEKADRVNDQVDTLLVLIDRAQAQGINDLDGLKTMVQEMFANDVKGVITLSSCHKAKGLEWETVYLLGREELMPSSFARQEWQIQQEINLIYVAVTRAKDALVEADLEPEEKDHRRAR